MSLSELYLLIRTVRYGTSTYFLELENGFQATAAKNLDLVHVYFLLYKMYQAT